MWRQRQRLLAAAPDDEGGTAFQPDHPLAACRGTEQQARQGELATRTQFQLATSQGRDVTRSEQ
jgi:hypothetical protein